jgi:hypothetical protein
VPHWCTFKNLIISIQNLIPVSPKRKSNFKKSPIKLCAFGSGPKNRRMNFEQALAKKKTYREEYIIRLDTRNRINRKFRLMVVPDHAKDNVKYCDHIRKIGIENLNDMDANLLSSIKRFTVRGICVVDPDVLQCLPDFSNPNS